MIEIIGCPFGKRVGAGFLDLLFFILALFPLLLVTLVCDAYLLGENSQFTNIWIIFDILFVLILNGAIFKEGSLGRKIKKIWLIDIKTKKKPNFMKLLLLNIVSMGSYSKFSKTRIDRRSLLEVLLNCSTVEIKEDEK